MTRDIRVVVMSPDPVLQAGIAHQLRGTRQVELVTDASADVDVVVLVTEAIDASTVSAVAARASSGEGVVVVASELDESSVRALLGAGAADVRARSHADAIAMGAAVRRAARTDTPSTEVTARHVLGRVERHAPTGEAPPDRELPEREVTILRLTAEGLATRDIATQLDLSERAVKYALNHVALHFGVSNRTQAVARAVRLGLI